MGPVAFLHLPRSDVPRNGLQQLATVRERAGTGTSRKHLRLLAEGGKWLADRPDLPVDSGGATALPGARLQRGVIDVNGGCVVYV